LAIVSCHSREDYSNVSRATWLPSVPEGLDVRFFRGRGAVREPKDDEVWLDCRDDYAGLPEKVKSIFEWGYDHGYDTVSKVDDDVTINVNKWLEGFYRCDFTGCRESACKPNEIQTPYGFFYVLNRKTMRLVLDSPLPSHGNDEAWVSTVLYTNGIYLKHDHRYFLHRGGRPRPEVRSLRAPKRDYPLVTTPPPDVFALCAYLNWGGFHMTPDAVNLQEIQWLYERYAK
jgi:hypothetical protein